MPVIERIAMAMHAIDVEKGRMVAWKDTHPSHKMVWLKRAIAAVETLRQPTPRMLKAAGRAMSAERRPTPARVSNNAKHGIRYRAMIDEILKESAAVSDGEKLVVVASTMRERLVGARGFEPLTFAMSGQRSTPELSARSDATGSHEPLPVRQPIGKAR